MRREGNGWVSSRLFYGLVVGVGHMYRICRGAAGNRSGYGVCLKDARSGLAILSFFFCLFFFFSFLFILFALLGVGEELHKHFLSTFRRT